MTGTANSIRVRGEVLHKPLQPFFHWINGKLEVKDRDNPTFFERTNGYPLKATKAVWAFTPILQAIGLVNENIGKLARAFYGFCWAIVYTCYRPWTYARRSLPENNDTKKNPGEFWRTVFNINEHFRFGMGTLVSSIYGGGAFGMLWSWFKGDDDLYDKAANVYQIGMFNQNQIFDSMNFTEVLKRFFLGGGTKYDNDKTKANIELVDSVLFLPTIITRAMDTFRLLGKEFSENTQKIINTFAYIGYGTWAARYGFSKQFTDSKVERGGGLLDDPNSNLKGNLLKTDKILRDTQDLGGKAFYTLLPGLSWLAASTELFGLKEFTQSAFKLEGILERLNPAIASWCVRNTWLKLFEKK